MNASQGSPARRLIRKVWRKYAMRDLTARDNYPQLDKLYTMPDPWNMRSDTEQGRFRLTNDLILSKTGRVGTLLEIGCGEGHQTQHFSAISDEVYGFDVSSKAVARARQRVPQARLDTGTIASLPWTPPGGRFDLVVACEVLYMMSDAPAALRRMSELGRCCFVTFFSPAARIVAKSVLEVPNVEYGWFYQDPVAWLWAFWRPNDANRGPR